MTQAILPALAGALSSQSRGRPAGDRPKVDSAIPALIAADKKKYNKIKKEADKERLYNLLTQPEVLGLLITLGGMVASQNIPFSQDPQANEAIKATATSASVLLGLGHAGVGDLTTMIVALGAGGGSLIGSLIGDTSLDLGKLSGWDNFVSKLDPTKLENWTFGLID